MTVMTFSDPRLSTLNGFRVELTAEKQRAEYEALIGETDRSDADRMDGILGRKVDSAQKAHGEG